MTAEVIAFPGTVRYRRGYLKSTRDFLVIREDGTLGFSPPKTPSPPRIGRTEVVEDFAAERRLAEQALERGE